MQCGAVGVYLLLAELSELLLALLFDGKVQLLLL